MYQVFAHTADVGLRIEADRFETLLEDSGRGLFSLIVANVEEIEPRISEEFRIEGVEPAYLLFDWLNELLFAFESRRILFGVFDVTVDERGLYAVAKGEPMDVTRHQLEHEVKAITYHGLSVAEHCGKWSAEVIVDI